MSAIATALAIIDTDGPDAVSIRRLARELNYSRSGLAYRIGSMPELEVEVFRAIAGELARTFLGHGAADLDDPAWIRAAVLRVLQWEEDHPNRARFLTTRAVPEGVRCPAVAEVLGQPHGQRVDIDHAAVHYLISSFAFMVEIVRLFGDRERALDAVAAHCAGTWRTLVLAAREPVAA